MNFFTKIWKTLTRQYYYVTESEIFYDAIIHLRNTQTQKPFKIRLKIKQIGAGFYEAAEEVDYDCLTRVIPKDHVTILRPITIEKKIKQYK